MSSIDHLKQQLQERKREYDLLTERISRLREAKAVETDVEESFKQETHLKELESTRNNLNNEIVALESRIETVLEASERYKSPKHYLEHQICKSYQFLLAIQEPHGATVRPSGEREDTMVAKYRSAINLCLRLYFQLCANLRLAPTEQIKAIASELYKQSTNESLPLEDALNPSHLFTKLQGTRIVHVVVSQLFRIADLLTRPDSVKAQKFYEALTIKVKARRALNRRTSF